MLYTKKSNINGRGLFAKDNIKKNTIIEYDIILIDKNIQNDDFIKYTFPFNMTHNCLCIGNITLCNHNNFSNIEIHSLDIINLKKKFIFTRDVYKDEEIFLNYGTNIIF